MELVRKLINRRLPGIAFWGSLIILSAIGILLLVYSTPFGPGLINDSVIYLGGAENILAGDGYSRTSGGGEIKPITVNPPFYPMVVAAVSLFGFSFIKSGWLISLACFFLNVILVGVLLRKLTRSDLLALLGAFLFTLSESFIKAHTFALTEPLFITISLASLLSISQYLDNGRMRYLVFSAILVNLSYLTRYIGIATLGAGLLALIVFQPTWKTRIKDSLIYLGLSLVGGILWMARNLIVSGNAANRSIGFHPLTLDKIREGVETFWVWILPNRFNLTQKIPALWDILTYLFIILFVIGLVHAWVRYIQGKITNEQPSARSARLALILASWAVLYFVALLFSLTFADASTALENRILAPLFTALLILFIFGVRQLLLEPQKTIQIVGLALVLLISASFVYDGRRAVIDLRQDGQGYTSSYFRNSPTIEMVQKLPPVILYSNRVPAINLLADRTAYALLAPVDPLTRQPRPGYQETLESIRNSVLEGKSVLVVFEAQDVFGDPVEGGWLRDLTKGVPVLAENTDGIIYGKITQ